ncbi:hypothetical protein F8388_026292 [Cannabis sativa]|uniref:DUF1985 domain-containing protein n=1 Tax=Cannabis sativa TaxID=3483 RepID=A0A7J6E6I6_CANSA|nr:hypothetical protein F8388_026292 [Cannabis sativa]
MHGGGDALPHKKCGKFECVATTITRSSISPSPSGSKRKDVGDEGGNVRKISLGDDKSDDTVSRDVVNERRSRKSSDSMCKDVVNERSKKINEKVAENVKKSSVSSLAKKKSRVPDVSPDDRKSKKLKLKSVAEVDEGDLESEDESSIAIPAKAKIFIVVRILLEARGKILWVRFGLGEFAVISGLLCKGDIDMLKYAGKGDVFVDKYFNDMTVTHGAVKQRFLSSTFKDDEFVVRMDVLYLVTNYLLSKHPDKHVSNGLLHLIESGVKEKVSIGGPIFDDVKDYVMRIINKKSEIGSSLKELRKDIDDKFDGGEGNGLAVDVLGGVNDDGAEVYKVTL